MKMRSLHQLGEEIAVAHKLCPEGVHDDEITELMDTDNPNAEHTKPALCWKTHPVVIRENEADQPMAPSGVASTLPQLTEVTMYHHGIWESNSGNARGTSGAGLLRLWDSEIDGVLCTGYLSSSHGCKIATSMDRGTTPCLNKLMATIHPV